MPRLLQPRLSLSHQGIGIITADTDYFAAAEIWYGVLMIKWQRQTADRAVAEMIAFGLLE